MPSSLLTRHSNFHFQALMVSPSNATCNDLAQEVQRIATNAFADRAIIVVRLHATEIEINIAHYQAEQARNASDDARPPIIQGSLDQTIAQMLICQALHDDY
jgi:hypothetical protein